MCPTYWGLSSSLMRRQMSHLSWNGDTSPQRFNLLCISILWVGGGEWKCVDTLLRPSLLLTGSASGVNFQDALGIRVYYSLPWGDQTEFCGSAHPFACKKLTICSSQIGLKKMHVFFMGKWPIGWRAANVTCFLNRMTLQSHLLGREIEMRWVAILNL